MNFYFPSVKATQAPFENKFSDLFERIGCRTEQMFVFHFENKDKIELNFKLYVDVLIMRTHSASIQ